MTPTPAISELITEIVGPIYLIILGRTNMEGRDHLAIFSLLMPLGVMAGPFFPLNVPVPHNYGYINQQFQYPAVQEIPSDFLAVKSPFPQAPGSPVCLTESCVVAAADLLKQMDRKVDPCQDFYKFSCGGFIADTVLPEHKTRTGFSVFTFIYRFIQYIIAPGSFNVLGDQLNQRLKKVFENEAEASEPRIYQGS